MQNQQEELTAPHLVNGPVKDRSCTDILCLLSFIAFSIAMFVIAGVSFKHGNPDKLAQPYDPDHRACGVDSGVERFPYIYFANPTNPKFLYVTTCVAECPNQNQGAQPESGSSSSTNSTPRRNLQQQKPIHHLQNNHKKRYVNDYEHLEDKTLKCATNSLVKSCEAKYSPTNPAGTLIIYNSKPYLNKICLPVSRNYFEKVSSAIDVQKLESMVEDVRTTKWVIIGSIGIAIVVSFVFLFFMEKCAGVVVWTFIALILGLLATAGGLSYAYYLALTNPSELPQSAQAKLDFQQMQEHAKANDVDPDTYKYLAFFFFGLLSLFIIMLICFFNRIRLAIAILKTAGDFVSSNPIILLIPIATISILITYFIYWTIVGLYLYSTGEVSKKPNQLPFGQFTFTTEQKVMGNMHLFGLFWNLSFIIATVEFIIAGAVCTWYFKQGPNGKDLGNPTMSSIIRFFKYHMGTVAVGSFLLAVINFIRFWLEYLYRNQEQLAKKNQILKYLMKCLICCMWCFEKCVQFINQNAYIVCNMNGKSFCPAAAEAVGLIIRNPIRFAVVGGLGEVFIAVGRIFISLMTGIICYLILTRSERYQNTVQHPEVPAILCAMVGFTIGSNFMSIYGIACDTLIVVFCMDEELEKQTGKPVQCPPALRDFMSSK